MKKKYSVIGVVLFGMAVTAVVGAVCESRKRRHHSRLSDVADKGYEMAADIIYPDSSRKNKKLRYGPVF